MEFSLKFSIVNFSELLEFKNLNVNENNSQNNIEKGISTTDILSYFLSTCNPPSE